MAVWRQQARGALFSGYTCNLNERGGRTAALDVQVGCSCSLAASASSNFSRVAVMRKNQLSSFRLLSGNSLIGVRWKRSGH